MNVKYKVFEDRVNKWEALLDQAAEFASQLGSDKLISITQTSTTLMLFINVSSVTVWYQEQPNLRLPEAAKRRPIAVEPRRQDR